MNMTEKRSRILWEIVNDQLEGIDNALDAEYVAEQWVCEIGVGLKYTF